MSESFENSIEIRLAELGIELPVAAKSVASYQPVVIDGDLVIVSGQLPMELGEIRYSGHLGQEVSLEEGVLAARLCAINVLAQLQAACEGALGRVERCVRLAGYVSSTAGFCDHPTVINGASDLIVDLFGERGQHARAAVGCSSLPLGAAVEVEAVFRIRR